MSGTVDLVGQLQFVATSCGLITGRLISRGRVVPVNGYVKRAANPEILLPAVLIDTVTSADSPGSRLSCVGETDI